MHNNRPDWLLYSGEDKKLAEMSAYPERFEKPGVTVSARDLQRFKQQQIKLMDGSSNEPDNV